jgi:hypothetical protein
LEALMVTNKCYCSCWYKQQDKFHIPADQAPCQHDVDSTPICSDEDW